MARMTQYRQILVVVRTPRVALRNDVMNVQRRRPVIPTNLTLILEQLVLTMSATLHNNIILQSLQQSKSCCNRERIVGHRMEEPVAAVADDFHEITCLISNTESNGYCSRDLLALGLF